MDLCKYKDILGQPLKGFHATRIGIFALWDIVGTIIGAYVIYKMQTTHSYVKILIGLLILGEILHYLFCVDTAFIKLF